MILSFRYLPNICMENGVRRLNMNGNPFLNKNYSVIIFLTKIEAPFTRCEHPPEIETRDPLGGRCVNYVSR